MTASKALEFFKEAIREMRLEAAATFALQFRELLPPLSAQAIEIRGAAAVDLATGYFGVANYVAAETWALRALQTQPRADAMLLLSELSYLNDNIEGAIAWCAAAEQLAIRGSDATSIAQITQQHARLTQNHFTRMVVPRAKDDLYKRTHGLVIMTMAGRETFAATCANVVANGGWHGPKTIIVDGDGPIPECVADWTWLPTATPKREGQARTLFRALELAHMKKWDYLTILEDDIALAPNALWAMQNAAMPANAAVAAWYSNAPQPFHSQNTAPCWVYNRMPTAATGVALTLPYHTIDTVLNSETFAAWTELHGGDAVFSMSLPGKFWATMYPNPIQHVGTVSLTGNTGDRQSPSFARCHDATRLFDRKR